MRVPGPGPPRVGLRGLGSSERRRRLHGAPSFREADLRGSARQTSTSQAQIKSGHPNPAESNLSQDMLTFAAVSRNSGSKHSELSNSVRCLHIWVQLARPGALSCLGLHDGGHASSEVVDVSPALRRQLGRSA